MSFQPTDETWHTGKQTGPRAGFWQRLVADVIDWVLLFIIALICEAVLHTAGDILGFLIWLGYFSYLEGGPSGQTLGKRAMHIRVISLTDSQPIGYGRACIRTLARILSEIPIFLGYLWMLWSPQRQTWHDKIGGAVVVPVDQLPRQPGAPW